MPPIRCYVPTNLKKAFFSSLILDVLGATAIAIMTAAGGLVQFIDAAYPDVLESKYKSAAFNYTIGVSGVTLTELNSAWAPVVEENPEVI